MKRLATRRLEEACGFRSGIVAPTQRVEGTLADLRGVHNVYIAGDGATASGGFARSVEDATCAAIGEALERYAAANARLPLREARELDGEELLPPARFALFSDAQRAMGDFPFAQNDQKQKYTKVFSLLDNRAVWVPEELVGLGSREGDGQFPSTSTGLAAGRDRGRALLGALDEALERDAFTVHWLGGLAGREVTLDERYTTPVRALRGEVRCFDLTQAWNPHPVAAVCGQLPMRGIPRIALGCACRPTWQDAVEKAWLEWLQGTVFAGYYLNARPGLAFADARALRDFDAHGAYYAAHPERWPRVPILDRPIASAPPTTQGEGASLEDLVRALARVGLEPLYRDLTTPDVADLGVTVVRVLVPGLALLHGDERWPFLGGRTRDVAWRFPLLPRRIDAWPSPFPHPLG